ncbi:MAG: hypothetical protein IPI81_16145 [Flavobacteriales bacterium]|nr:hypothetical protein [Flavobacteriales bacterium]
MKTMQAAIDNPYLDTIISLVLVYALLSVLVSVLLEAWNRRTKERGVFLQKVIIRLLDDPLNKNYGYLIYQHPIINKMRSSGNSYPHYIPAEGFANALVDTLADQAVVVRFKAFLGEVDVDDAYRAGTLTAEQLAQVVLRKIEEAKGGSLAERLKFGVERMADSELKRLLRNFISRNESGEGDARTVNLDNLKTELGRWFDDFMDRCSGEFKLNQRKKLQLMGLAVALLLNVDSIHLAKVFFMDPSLRERMVERAEGVSDAVRQSRDTTEVGLRNTVLHTLSEMDTTKLSRLRNDSTLIRSLNFLMNDDSLVVQRRQADSLLMVLDQWQLPIGWSSTEAPSSWKGQWRTWSAKEPMRVNNPLTTYFEVRNHGSVTYAFLWVLGIIITTWTLSLGAPFWFEALVKLINIRRSGPKPKTTAERNA